ncbi:lipoprotein [Thiomicrorhabdus immobilis]|uniref:Lipoprotein n=1 Tax=Thiomicrorhabdus immobilis TaxID=2791037 RepID=A0ABM7MFK7_9GAMM|nr:ChaN family lipoprotein [Thiomicrorhabdus immobilis]BCN94247.1 lipoprotein [Thiomicrorhabdus immobilis]
MYNFASIQSLLATALLCNLSLLSGCAENPAKASRLIDVTTLESNPLESNIETQAKLEHAYDYVLLDQSKQPVTLETAISQLRKADIVVIGEYHGNHASHLLEMQLLAGLYRQNPQLLLSMEMFNRDQQPLLNDYLDGNIGEAYLINEAPAWNNYAASYRPLVEFAKNRFIGVIAANAPADTIRCIGREGESYISKLAPEERLQIAQQPFAEIPGYKKRFYEFLKQTRPLAEPRKHKSYLAQTTRDNTMAESIYQAWLNHPNHQVVHINGTFHSQNHLGTVAALKRLDPNLNIQVITPAHVDEFNGLDKLNLEANLTDEFIYLLKPQPEQYVNAAYKLKVRKAQFDKAEQATCK